MVICFKCRRNSEDDRNTVFFDFPSALDNIDWRKAFLRSLGIENLQDERITTKMSICDRHFRTDDLEMRDGNLCLKENSIPSSDDCEFFEVKPELKPELVYYSNNCEMAEDDSYETQDLAPLEPLVEYVYGDEKSCDAKSEDNTYTQKNKKSETAIVDGNIKNERKSNSQAAATTTAVGGSAANVVEPMMPFFLSSPMFTIFNENCEEDTIIIQIENQDDLEDKIIPYKSRLLNTGDVSMLESRLCPIGDDITQMYMCEVCQSSYGCINCLKSHYKTLHISTTQIMKYKCEKSNNVSRNYYCPVCELCFNDRDSTMNHYLTHSVVCLVCGSGFETQRYLTEHLKSAHNQRDQDPSFDCVLCTLSYRYAANLTKHYRLYHKMILCHICLSHFETTKELQMHEKQHWPKLDVLPFACSKCNKAFSKTSDIAVHIRQEHSTKHEKDEDNNASANQYAVPKGGGSNNNNKDHKPRKKKMKVK